MAKATEKLHERLIILELSEEEAVFLGDVLARVGGSEVLTRRQLSDNIYRALTVLVPHGPSAADINGSLICLREGEYSK